MEDCDIVKNFVGGFTFDLEKTILTNCNFTIPEKMLVKSTGAKNGYITIGNSVINNCTFENWLGRYKGNNSTYTNEGIVFKRKDGETKRIAIDDRSRNNTFKNCAVIFRHRVVMTDFKFVGDNLLTDDLPDGELYSYFFAYPYGSGSSSALNDPEYPNLNSVFNRCSFVKTKLGGNSTDFKMKLINCYFDEYCVESPTPGRPHDNNYNFFLPGSYVFE
jgi:hypothetical protein